MKLFVFSSNRSLGRFYAQNNTPFLPEAKGMQEFFNDIIIVPNKTKIPKYLRNILLWQTVKNIEIENLGFDRAFLRFLENSTFLFNFFDELESSKVNIDDIDTSDTYGDYADHLKILKKIQTAYKMDLEKWHLFDSIEDFTLNTKYLKHYENIIINIDGVLSPKDFYILQLASNYTSIHICFSYTQYNAFIFDRIFQNTFEIDTKYTINIADSKIISSQKINTQKPKITAYGFEMRINQALLVIAKVNEWLQKGYENIAVILPNEEFSKYLQIFDTKRNLNYAMGIKDIALINKIKALKNSDFSTFNPKHSKLKNILSIIKLENEIELLALESVFENLSYEDICDFLLLNIPHLDDNKGGKVKVIGILESRGMDFERVIIVDFNEDTIPKLNNNDMFLNTKIRKHSKMPTLKDKENLQRHYYHTLIQNAKEIEIAFHNTKLPSTLLNQWNIQIKNGDSLWRFFPKEITKTFIQDTFCAKNTRLNLSASMLKTFLDCKLKFYFRYLCNFQTSDNTEENDSSILHYIFKNLGDDFDISKLPHLIEESTKQYPISKKFNLKIITNQLKNFFKEQQNRLKNGIKIIAREEKREFYIDEFKFTCYIDRIDKTKDGVEIIDYKLKKHFDKKNEGFLQLLIYEKALQHEYNNITCYYYDLYTNTMHKMESNDKAEAEEKLKEILKELKSEQIDFSKCENKAVCQYCDYKYLCDRY